MIEAVKKTDKAGINNLTCYDEEYSANIILYNGDLILDGNNKIEGATLEDNIYEFGNKDTDVATNSEEAKNMVILKVNGNLTIDSGITVTACKSDEGYGGPKGMFIYCTGTLTNNGTITMNKRGAKAEGQNVILWQNKNNGAYNEFIPAVGAETGKRTGGYSANGNNGKDGIGRQTGGGGTGSAINGYGTGSGHRSTCCGIGGTGTSYSGGTGGGAAAAYNGYTGEDGNNSGGTGGKGSAASGYSAGGGAGNPGGIGINASNGVNGTGGLLIIYGNIIENTGIISSNGEVGGYGNASGGSSGGGSINIFYMNRITKGIIEASGGKRTTGASRSGGAGGTGTITIGNIATGAFIKDE